MPAPVLASVKAGGGGASLRLLQPRSRLGWANVLPRRRRISCSSCCPYSTISRDRYLFLDDHKNEPRVLTRRIRTRRTASSLSRASSSCWKVDPISGLVESSIRTQQYQVVVGLEIHAQLDIPTKLFSSAHVGSTTTLSNSSSTNKANTAIAPFDVALPGVLPVVSGAAVRAAVLAAAALQCRAIAPVSRFERKHYAYADLPHGYQITQQRWPLARDGLVEARVEHEAASGEKAKNKKKKTKKKNQQHTVQCRIHRIQLEVDTGKTTTYTAAPLHQSDSDKNSTTTVSRVDFNRAGTALIEIVTEPDLRSSVAAAATAKCIRQLLQHCGSCQGRMEAGQLRVDCNVNVVAIENNGSGSSSSSNKTKKKSPRVEIKNLNSLEQVRDAVNYEAARHAELLSSSNDAAAAAATMVEETRTWNVREHRTELLRRKDAAPDYRFLPEPDLPPLVLNEHVLHGSKSVQEFVHDHLPELPAAAVERLQQQHGLSESQARALAQDPPAIAFFDEAMRVVSSSRSTATNNDSVSAAKKTAARAMKVANLICNELMALIKEDQQLQQSAMANEAAAPSFEDDSIIDDENVSYNHSDDAASIRQSKVSAPQLGEIVLLLEENAISTTMAKKLLTLLYAVDDQRGASPRQVAAQHGLQLVTDADALRDICRAVIRDNPDLMDVYRRGGKFITKMQKLMTGKAMEASRGNAHPERLREILYECLEEQAAANKKW